MRFIRGTAGPAFLMSAVAALFFANSARAQFTWTNAAGGNWSLPANWGGTAPPSGGGAAVTLTFPQLSPSYITTNDLPAGGVFNLNQLNFGNTTGNTVTLNPSSGSTLNFTGTSPGITVGTGTDIINLPFGFDTTTIIGGGGILNLNAAITGVAGGTPDTPNVLVNNNTGTLNITGGGTFDQLSVRAGTTSITGATLNLVRPNNGDNSASGLQIGQASGQTASVTISGGTTVNVTENVYVGDVAGSTGTLTVTGAGTVLNLQGGASNRLGVGNFGSGTLNITNGAVINTGRLFTPRQAGATSTIVIDGPGSTLHITAQISIASNGPGNVTVSNGGSILVDATAVVFNMGANAPGTGTLTITGAGSNATVNTTFVMGNTAGGAGPFGVVLQNGGTFLVGGTGQFQMNRGASTFTVNAGSSLTTNNASFIGTNEGTSILNVTGAGAVWNALNSNQIGGSGTTPSAGTGAVTVSSGGVVNETSSTFLYAPGTINANTGGTYNTGLLADGVAGTSVGNVVTQSGGVLGITGIAATFGTYSGVISGPGSVVVSGVPTASNQIFSGLNTYSGGTTINNGGRLAISGQISGPVTINNGGTLLGGTATTTPGVIAGAIQVNSGGTLTGGSDPNLSPTGIVNARGPVTMASGSTYSLLMNGNTPGGGTTSHNQLDLTGGGSIALGNAFLQTGLGYSPAPTDTINFIVGGPVTGIFSGRPDNSSFFVGTFGGQNFAATIHYTTNSVFLNNFSPVPEPLHILAIGGLAVGGFGWWKKRRKA